MHIMLTLREDTRNLFRTRSELVTGPSALRDILRLDSPASLSRRKMIMLYKYVLLYS